MLALALVFALIELIVFGIVGFVVVFVLAMLYYASKALFRSWWRHWRARRLRGAAP